MTNNSSCKTSTMNKKTRRTSIAREAQQEMTLTIMKPPMINIHSINSHNSNKNTALHSVQRQAWLANEATPLSKTTVKATPNSLQVLLNRTPAWCSASKKSNKALFHALKVVDARLTNTHWNDTWKSARKSFKKSARSSIQHNHDKQQKSHRNTCSRLKKSSDRK